MLCSRWAWFLKTSSVLGPQHSQHGLFSGGGAGGLSCWVAHIWIRTEQMTVEPTAQTVSKGKTPLPQTQVPSEAGRGCSYRSVYLGEGSGSDCPLAETNSYEPRSVQGSRSSSADDSAVPPTPAFSLRPEATRVTEDRSMAGPNGPYVRLNVSLLWLLCLQPARLYCVHRSWGSHLATACLR